MSLAYDKTITPTLRIIVADDDQSLSNIIKAILEIEGYQVRISINADQIVEMVSKERPDIILLDIHMKRINGCEICKNLKSGDLTRDIPVIIVSGDDDLENAALLCGADDFLPKPFGADELIYKLNETVSKNKLLA